MKVTTIEEAQDISIIKVDELIGSLLTFKMEINNKSKKRNQSVAFKADIEDVDEHVEEDIDDNLTESVILIAKRFGNVM